MDILNKFNRGMSQEQMLKYLESDLQLALNEIR